MRRPRATRLTSFGDEPEPVVVRTEPEPRSVSEVVQAAQAALARPDLEDLWVRGEVSNLTLHASGHWYFRLKDERNVLDAAMFRAANARVRFRPEEGMEVLARGRLGVYGARSSLQVVVEELRPVGVGPLALAFEQTKRRLEAEGLFRDERKRPIPPYPATLGVVTSLQGAVLRDVVRTARRRFPAVRILVAGARVQGAGAAEEVARGIERLNQDGSPDVLIVARGGGSQEELWAFNEERLVRAVAASRIPVISAVGHETDFTLCDFAADLRASTPTAAAERASPDGAALRDRFLEDEHRLARALQALIPGLRQDVDGAATRAGAALRRRVAAEGALLAQRAARLEALSPLGVLARGYAVALRDGRVVREPADAPVGSDVEVRLAKGKVQARVTKHGEED